MITLNKQELWLRRLQSSLMALAVFGVLIFGGVFMLSFSHPVLIEQAAREVVRIEVERRVGEKIDALSDMRVSKYAQRVLRQTDSDIAATRQAIRDELPRKTAYVIAAMLRPDCECRQRLAQRAQAIEHERLVSLTAIRDRLATLVESAYASVAHDLMRELRIFSGANAIAFALLGLLTCLRRRDTWQLLLPALVLIGAVALTGGFYLFEQNWLHTIMFGDYTGLAYGIYLAAIALLLTDIVFNRARLTTRMVRLVADVLGAAVPTPC